MGKEKVEMAVMTKAESKMASIVSTCKTIIFMLRLMMVMFTWQNESL